MSAIKFNATPPYQTIFFGEYLMPTGVKPNDIFARHPIEWLVLEKDLSNRTALLLAKYVIDWEPIDDLHIKSWKNSYLREWLNSEFYEKSFSPEEQQMIIPTHTEGNIRNKNYTIDKVFLLAKEDVEKYFSPDEAATRQPMIITPLSDTGSSESDPIMIYCDPIIWWTRTLGSHKGRVICVDHQGAFFEADADCDEYGVRPAIRIQL